MQIQYSGLKTDFSHTLNQRLQDAAAKLDFNALLQVHQDSAYALQAQSCCRSATVPASKSVKPHPQENKTEQLTALPVRTAKVTANSCALSQSLQALNCNFIQASYSTVLSFISSGQNSACRLDFKSRIPTLPQGSLCALPAESSDDGFNSALQLVYIRLLLEKVLVAETTQVNQNTATYNHSLPLPDPAALSCLLAVFLLSGRIAKRKNFPGKTKGKTDKSPPDKDQDNPLQDSLAKTNAEGIADDPVLGRRAHQDNYFYF